MIDEDGGGTIDRLEWMMYNVGPKEMDPSSGLEYYDLQLRELFDKFDEDRNGMIDSNEMVDFLEDFFKAQLKPLGKEEKALFRKSYITILAGDIMAEMTRDQLDKKAIEWKIFKFVKIACKKRLDEAENFINRSVKEHMIERMHKEELEN